MYTTRVIAMQPTVVVERPPEGPARGKWEAGAWLYVLVAIVAVLGAAGFWAWRLRKSRKAGR